MRILKTIFFFYSKLIVPAIALSVRLGLVGLGISGEFSFKTVGVSYVFLGLLFHYFTYEVNNFNEYYFYYNMGLSRLMLWITTFILSFIIGMVFILV